MALADCVREFASEQSDNLIGSGAAVPTSWAACPGQVWGRHTSDVCASNFTPIHQSAGKSRGSSAPG